MKETTTSYKKHANGSYTRTGRIVQRPEDGWQESFGPSMERRKGWGIWFTWETDNPQYTRPLLLIFLVLFLAAIFAFFWYGFTSAETDTERTYILVIWAAFVLWILYVGNGLRKSINRREREQQAAVRAAREKKRLARLADTALPSDRAEVSGETALPAEAEEAPAAPPEETDRPRRATQLFYLGAFLLLSLLCWQCYTAARIPGQQPVVLLLWAGLSLWLFRLMKRQGKRRPRRSARTGTRTGEDPKSNENDQ